MLSISRALLLLATLVATSEAQSNTTNVTLPTKVTLNLTAHEGVFYTSIVRVVPGQVLEVLLDDNPTTGYQWQTVSEEFTQTSIGKVLRYRNESYTPRTAEEVQLAGMGGTLAIEYDVIASGGGNLILYNARP